MAATWDSENTPSLFSEIWTLFDRGELVAHCAWCGRVRIAETWVFPPNGALDAIDARLSTSHSICPTCAETVGAPASQRDQLTSGVDR
jgi:hypothetical protein